MCLVIQANYHIIPSHTCIWACNGKRKESKATVFCGNLIGEECWRWEGVHSPFAPHPLAVTVREWDGVTDILFCGQRVGRLAGGFGGWVVVPWLSQSCLHAYLFGC